MTEIVLHSSLTKPNEDIGLKELSKKDPYRKNTRYHYVIRRDGTLEYGIPSDIPARHMIKHNKYSLSICLVGGKSEDGKVVDNFELIQRDTLVTTVKAILVDYPKAKLINHGTHCIVFDIDKFLKEYEIDRV